MRSLRDGSSRVGRALVLGIAAVGLGTSPAPGPTFERAIVVPQPGKVFLVLDRAVYEGARPDLADLRVRDDTGAQVPYLLEEPWVGLETTLKQPRLFNRAFARNQSTTVTLDFGGPLLKSGLVLSLSGENFRRRVMVEGRNKHERPWATLTDSAFVFAIPEPSAARFETVSLPENNYQYLRVTVFNGPDDPTRIEVLNAWARSEERRQPKEVVLAPIGSTRSEIAEGNETHLTLDLGARHQPFRAVMLDVADEEFFRGVIIEARREPAPALPGQPAAPISWAKLGEGSLYRYQTGGRTAFSERRVSAAGEGGSTPPETLHDAGPGARTQTYAQLRLDVVGRERVLRLRIANRDDRPLEVRGVTLTAPVERLVFLAVAGRTYRLTYGVPHLPRPEYDIQRTVRDPAVWIAQGQEGTLSAPIRISSAAPTVPWTERHRGILWGGLVTVVVLLGAVTWRALKSV